MQILVYKDIPNKLGETPMSVVSSSNSKYNQCIPYGDTINGNYISDPESPYRYSDNYYLWWANKTSSNQYKLINSYQKESRSPSATINGQFYRLYCMANSNNISTDGVSWMHQNKNIWTFDYVEWRRYYTIGMNSADITNTVTYPKYHEFHYSVLGNAYNTQYFFNGFGIDYIGNEGYSYDTYLIYSKPTQCTLRELTSVFYGPSNNTTNINITTDYRLAIIDAIIADNILPTKLKTVLKNFSDYIKDSGADHVSKQINPISDSNQGITSVNSLLYYRKQNITPITNPNVTGFCYTSLMYEVLNRLPYPYSSNITLTSLDEGYKIPPYAGSGTYTINEGTIIVSDIEPYDNYTCMNTTNSINCIPDNLLYNTFLYNHINNINNTFHNDVNILHKPSNSKFYYVTYFMLVKMSRLTTINSLNINNYVINNYCWSYTPRLTSGGNSYLEYKNFDINSNPNKLIPIPLFTIAIDYDSYALVDTSISRVPASLLNKTNISGNRLPLLDYFPNMFQGVYYDTRYNYLYEVSSSSSGTIYSTKAFRINSGSPQIIPQY